MDLKSCTPSSNLMAIHHFASLKMRHVHSTVMMLKRSQNPPGKRTLATQIRSSVKDQMFEDNSNGIICYRDDRGEIICEGLDEGPCLRRHNQFSRCSNRDAEILELHKQQWLQILQGLNGNGSFTIDQDVNCNGFNTSR